jgi:nitrate reductase gamma subunit
MTTATTTPTDIRYEHMHIDMTNIFLYLFTRIISVVEDLDMNFEYLARKNR